MEDYYKILGVNETASHDQIKKAYRKQSLKNHPDRGGNKEEFQKINEAFQNIGDEHKRQQYDMQRRNPFMQGGPMNMGGAEDIFKMFFGGGMPFGFAGGPANVQMFHNGRPVNMGSVMKPSPINKTIEISIEEAFTGVNKPVEIERWIQMNGTKRVEKERLYIPIPAGIDNQEIIVVEGKGNVVNENIKGDIKIYINVKNNTQFGRDGLNLIYKQSISLKDALTGFKFDIKHISGKTYTINNNNGKIITPNYSKTIQHMGMKRERKHPAPPMVGNLIIIFEVEFPNNLTEEQCKILKECL